MKTPFIAIILTIATAFAAMAQDVRYLSFKQEKLAYAPSGYYISDVVDERENKGTIGHINANGATNDLSFQVPVASVLNAFIKANVIQHTDAAPITLHIQKLDVNISKNGAAYNVNATMSFAFYAGDSRVEQFSGSAGGQTDKDPYVYTEQLIRQNLEDDLKKFGEWWEQHKGKVVTNKNMKVVVVMGQMAPAGTIVYTTGRQLRIEDFTGPANATGTEAAETASGIFLSPKMALVDGREILTVTVSATFDMNESWFKNEAKNPYVLAHEQGHFDITAIKTCELVAKIRNTTTFSTRNYTVILDKLYAQVMADMKAEQTLYDAETNHSIITDKQVEWQNKIKEEVKTVGCY